MTKIKNFRIALRSREIARTLKNRDHLQVTPALEASIEHAIRESRRLLQPAALYTTLTRAVAEKATPLALPPEAVAVSVIAISIGEMLEAERATAVSHQDGLQAQLLWALQDEALSQSIQFAMRLIQDQAKEEECEMSPPQPVQDAPLYPSLATLLGVQRIGIPPDTASQPLPPYVRLVWTAWVPVAKRSTKRPSPAGRTEKAAV